jgi:hypothetical protein
MREHLQARRRAWKRKAVVKHLRFLARAAGGRPLPLWYWTLARSALQLLHRDREDSLVPSHNYLRSSGAILPIEELASILREDKLGAFALDAETLAFLWNYLVRTQPTIIIECGSGLSTIVFAHYLAKFRAADSEALLISLEQDQQVRSDVEMRLIRAHLQDYARILHAPLDEVHRYSQEALDEFESLRIRGADLLLIDGPFGPPGCRVWTLPSLLPYCRSGARWFLDDGFRDAEFAILKKWARASGIAVEGIHPLGKGLATGRVVSGRPPRERR